MVLLKLLSYFSTAYRSNLLSYVRYIIINTNFLRVLKKGARKKIKKDYCEIPCRMFSTACFSSLATSPPDAIFTS